MPPRDFLSQLGKALNGRRAGEADIWTNFQVVRPLDPRGLTVVKSECNVQEIVVGNVSGLTFAPGASVMIGTNTNRPGKAIIAGAPPGRMGASLVPQDFASRSYGSAPAPAVTCPVPITGRNYTGIRDTGSALYADLYADGALTSAIVNKSYSGVFSSPSIQFIQRVHAAAVETAYFKAVTPAFNLGFVTWNISANTFAVLTVPTSSTVGGPVVVGTDVYFSVFRTSPRGISLYKTTVGATGTLSFPGTIVGSALNDSNLTVHSGSLLHHGGEVFSVPGAVYSGAECIPYFSGGAWNLGLGRAGMTGLPTSSNRGGDEAGFPVSGSRSLRITYHLPGLGANPTIRTPDLGLLEPGPATPEVGLFAADFAAALGPEGTLTALSVSPSALEFACKKGSDAMFRFLVADAGFALGGCSIVTIPVAVGSAGTIPQAMLCRDN